MDMINKNIFYNQEISTEEKSLKINMFDYFYYILNDKNKTSLFTLYLFHFLEVIQLISFAFSSQYISVWKTSEKAYKVINTIASGSRLSPLARFAPFNVYIILFIVIFIFIFVFFLLLIIQIIFRNANSKIYNKLLSITHISIAPLTIFFYIPIIEFLFLPMKCDENTLTNLYSKCWNGLHIIIFIFGLLGSLLFFISIFFLNYHYFYPFLTGPITIKLNSSIDLFLLDIKLVFLLINTFIKNNNLSIALLLILSFFLLINQFYHPVYNIDTLELILNLRNTILFWTFFMLLIANLCVQSTINKLIYLLIFGYPIIIFSFIMFFKEYKTRFHYKSSSFNNINSCLTKTRFLINIIDSFIEDHKTNVKYNENINQKNDILLKGIIQLHTETCLKEDCPLTKFIKNPENYNIQKQCLLNYMSIFFCNAIKKFPDSILLRLHYIHFNYNKKYNLNGVRANLEEIKKFKCTTTEEYVLYCLEQEIIKMKIKDVNNGSEVENESIIIENNYRRLKDLISNCTKLYVEFWGIFATNITNNLNNLKLYKLGEKLNIYLKEINYLWEINLKNKKIDVENENNAQLYSKFLREILWDQKRSDLVQKKINEEHNIHGYNNIIEEKPQLDNLETILESQDYLIFVSSNDKGKCNILQFSNSLSYLIGYQRQEIINKPLEILMPSIFIDGHSKKVEEYIKNYHSQKISDKDSFRGGEKKNTLILIKNKMGYLVPFNTYFKIYDDNDFSNSFIFKARLELRDTKSIYAYYILTKLDFSVDSISSSAIHLGLTMDLLKKYVIKLNILVRTSKNNILNLFDRYKEYEDDTKKVTWIFPDIIYPKDDVLKNKDTPIQDLIKQSQKKKFYLQIFDMKYNEREIIGFVFKFISIKKKKKIKEIDSQELIPNYNNEILFDLLNLNYIRTVTVKEKSGLRNLREKKEQNNCTLFVQNNDIKRKNKKKKNKMADISEISSDEERKPELLLTKEKILELQARDSNGIKIFINLLPFYGNDISLIKHTPNKEHYPAGKAQEPLIKIDISNYIKRIEARIRENPAFYKKLKSRQKTEKLNSEESSSIKASFISSAIKEKENNNKEIEEINRDFDGDSSFSLINIFNIKSIKIVKFVDFFIYIIAISITVIEFILTYMFLIDNKNRFYYLSNSYKLLIDIAYTKYFITEAILSNYIPNYILLSAEGKDKFILYIQTELGHYREDISNCQNIYTSSNIDFSDEYKNYTSNTNITIKTLSNGYPKDEQQPFFSAISKLTTSIFYISTINDNSKIDLNNTYSYELMVNLLNGYYKSFQKLIVILFDDFINKTQNSGIKNIIIFSLSLFFTIIYLLIFWKIMSKLDNDREKPINLFLTIKKKIFEDLKNSSENFSNKLLNKFFGVDENEEESQQDYRANVKPNDINIAKFKALNEFKSLNNKKSSFIYYFFQLAFFYFIYNVFTLLKYINTRMYFYNINKFTQVYNSTQFSQINIVLSIDIVKQFFLKESLESFNFNDNQLKYYFLNTLLEISEQLEDTIKQISKTDCFLKDKYKDIYLQYMYGNFSDIIFDSLNIPDISNIAKRAEVGFKSISFNIFEVIRFLIVKYCDEEENIIIDYINDQIWTEIGVLLPFIVRPFYNKIDDSIQLYFYEYIEDKILTYIVVFVIVIIIISLYYWILWKRYEDNFIDSIKKSFDLINLIPEEIKNIIVNKLNEQN